MIWYLSGIRLMLLEKLDILLDKLVLRQSLILMRSHKDKSLQLLVDPSRSRLDSRDEGAMGVVGSRKAHALLLVGCRLAIAVEHIFPEKVDPSVHSSADY